MANLEQKANSVETTDLLNKAVQDAMKRIAEVEPSATLVDSISKEDWVAWNALDEKALVADSCGLHDDEDDCADGSLQAA